MVSHFSALVRNSSPGGIRVPGRLDFVFSHADVAVVNGVRRSILMDVPTVGFKFDSNSPDNQDIKIVQNSGNLHNEIIGDRVSLLPLALDKFQLSSFKPSSWRFELDVSNKGSKPVDVTSKDITVVPVDATEEALNPANLFRPDPVTGDHPIVTVLMPPKHGVTQRLVLEATASFGTGKDHARFSPVSVCAFTPLIDEPAAKKERAKRDDKSTFDALDARRMVLKGGDGKPAGYNFFLESQCGMSPEEIVEAGIEALSARLRAVADGMDGSGVTDVPPQADSPADIKSVKLMGETETVGALVQMELLQSGDTDYAGYFTPHHLETSIVVRLRVKDGKTPRGMIRSACESAASKIENVLTQWRKAAGR